MIFNHCLATKIFLSLVISYIRYQVLWKRATYLGPGGCPGMSTRHRATPGLISISTGLQPSPAGTPPYTLYTPYSGHSFDKSASSTHALSSHRNAKPPSTCGHMASKRRASPCTHATFTFLQPNTVVSSLAPVLADSIGASLAPSCSRS